MILTRAQEDALFVLSLVRDPAFTFKGGKLRPNTYNTVLKMEITRSVQGLSPEDRAEMVRQCVWTSDHSLVMTKLPTEATKDLAENPDSIGLWEAFAAVVVEVFKIMRDPRYREELNDAAEAARSANKAKSSAASRQVFMTPVTILRDNPSDDAASPVSDSATNSGAHHFVG